MVLRAIIGPSPGSGRSLTKVHAVSELKIRIEAGRTALLDARDPYRTLIPVTASHLAFAVL